MEREIAAAYAARAAEYTDLLGTMDAVHPHDRDFVERWADGCDGPVLDAGCGPGHWTAHLAQRGTAAIGLDAVPDFIQRARGRAPGVPFRVATLEATGFGSSSFAGVLSWYSLIHHEPDRIHEPLDEFTRIIRPGGRLLLGFFEGTAVQPFDHAVTTAYRWPIDRMAGALAAHGFEVTDVQRRTIAGKRPHAAVAAVRP
ncbi:class I SAM-dependent methyltransferase [Curtobacterium sp. 22159]|uniref:class I SAM-dependent methyltransferase n=1 Tax=Curtobacterium sp. 22159 TaxID=3453882 RepID=UPI003F87AC97